MLAPSAWKLTASHLELRIGIESISSRTSGPAQYTESRWRGLASGWHWKSAGSFSCRRPLVLKNLGVYSYVQMSDGKLIKMVTLLTGVGGRFVQAMKSGEPFEFHLARLVVQGGQMENTVVAIRGKDGVLFAIDVESGQSAAWAFAPIIYGLIGGIFVLTIFFSWIGVPFLFVAHRYYKKNQQINALTRYVRGLKHAVQV